MTASLLTAVSVVCRECLSLQHSDLQHVAHRIDEYLDVVLLKWTVATGYTRSPRPRLLQFCWMARIRSSRREKPAVQAATAHDIDFGHLWRQLRAAGWTSKRPTGLQKDWRYSSPDESHVFVGEIAVVNYVFESGLLEDTASDGQVHTEYGDEAAEYSAEEHVVGLLVARMLCPQKRCFSAHWTMVEDGALPAGNFGRYMTRDRCQNIMRDLHFVDNTTANRHDKLWKLRPVVDRIQQQFLAGWSLPAVFSFDEGVLPSTSRRNTTRMFMSDKPHRYGSKLLMMCDAKTAYCHRRLFCAKCVRRNIGVLDYKTGAAAVVRNLKVVLDAHSRHTWHAIVIDRYYSSVLLAVELLAMKVYVVGTVMTIALGLIRISSRRGRLALQTYLVEHFLFCAL
ncbi:hypothetical protein PHMEG_00010001 [Phytophthora megakarya]|uniref:PiggyBac transposable element-derived protein domain-containing protein n=1 Tax=Phytophthora megakarya TaxID=4795 RepID=A0A225WH84_9STRA|nr:hypothetical protein PHMEG_00010001 [Phytophthora megakarya]